MKEIDYELAKNCSVGIALRLKLPFATKLKQRCASLKVKQSEFIREAIEEKLSGGGHSGGYTWDNVATIREFCEANGFSEEDTEKLCRFLDQDLYNLSVGGDIEIITSYAQDRVDTYKEYIGDKAVEVKF